MARTKQPVAKQSAAKQLTSLADHPRAALGIRRAKAIGGLAGFGIAILAGLRNGTPLTPMLLRGIEFGLVGNLVAWAAAVAVWRRLLTAHATATVRHVRMRREAAANPEKAD
jgi:uncharacterized membrane protein YccC